MSQIRDIVTLVIVSALLGTSTATASPKQSVAHKVLATSITARGNRTAPLKQAQATVNEDTYSFAMTLPNSKSRFAKLSFSFTKPDRDNEVAPIYLDSMATTAFVGTSNAPETAIAIQDTTIDETGTVWVELDSSLPPNTTLTVVFRTRKPLSTGLYQYSIAAYPTTKSSGAKFVGNGMLTIPQ